MWRSKNLILNADGTVSIGRLAFWLSFALAVFFWLTRPVSAFPSSLEATLAATLAYNLGNYALDILSGRKFPENTFYRAGNEEISEVNRHV